MPSITTVGFPTEIPLERRGQHWYARAGERELRLSNLDKVYWPENGYTKGDLLTYYFNISPVMLPHIYDRPLTMKRMPNGVVGPYFYEKNAPSHKPSWLPTLPVFAENESKVINFVTVHDVAHMLWVANLGCIEFHPLHARGADQKRPDYAFFDLDPFPPAAYDEVKHVALLIKLLLDRLGLVAYPKTSGATGMQIMVPLDGTTEYDWVRGFVGAVSDLVHEADPDTTTLEWEVKNRTGKVFLDVNMNREGANIAAAYSVRPEWGATVSAPFSWDEIEDVEPSRYSIETIFERVDDVGDPFLPVAEGLGQSLDAAIQALEAKPRKAREFKR
ncbi:MAG: non-homologous end-joining DNA ligase [Actinomycetota bacterium]|nr:non-homologous end-joining DNA ligase [Actinomycetota bacterium]